MIKFHTKLHYNGIRGVRLFYQCLRVINPDNIYAPAAPTRASQNKPKPVKSATFNSIFFTWYFSPRRITHTRYSIISRCV